MLIIDRQSTNYYQTREVNVNLPISETIESANESPRLPYWIDTEGDRV